MINNMNHMINMHMINNEHDPHADGRAVFFYAKGPKGEMVGRARLRPRRVRCEVSFPFLPRAMTQRLCAGQKRPLGAPLLTTPGTA